MPESLVDKQPEATSEGTRPGYEPPTVTPIGNARDLLAGSVGTSTDATPVPGQTKQPGA